MTADTWAGVEVHVLVYMLQVALKRELHGGTTMTVLVSSMTCVKKNMTQTMVDGSKYVY